MGLYFEPQRITRHNRPAKTGAVHADKVVSDFLVGRVDTAVVFKRKQRCRLSQRFDDEHAGHDGVMWKMACKKRLVHRHILNGYDAFTGNHFQHAIDQRSEEHTSELQSLMRISYAVFCLKKKQKQHLS